MAEGFCGKSKSEIVPDTVTCIFSLCNLKIQKLVIEIDDENPSFTLCIEQ